MKILIFTTQINLLAGAEKLAVELTESLNAEPGIEANLLVMGPEGESGTEKIKLHLLARGVKSVLFLGRPHNTRGRNILRYLFKLRDILQTGNYDFIETSQMGPTILACWATLGLRTQHIAGIHEIYQKDHQKTLSHKFQRFSVRVNRTVHFYSVSKEACSSWIEYAQISPDRVRVIYNSIAEENFENINTLEKIDNIQNFGGSERKVLFVGRLSARKGLDILIDALGHILEVGRIHLLIVGWPDKVADTFYPDEINLLENLSKKIEKHGWVNRIHFLGKRDDIPKIMNFADLLVHPPRDEGFGLVLAEALAAGLPIVATNVGGIPEVLADTDAVLVPPNAPSALRKAVIDILNRSPEEIAQSSRKARQRAEFFRPERRTADMIAMFDELSV